MFLQCQTRVGFRAKPGFRDVAERKATRYHGFVIAMTVAVHIMRTGGFFFFESFQFDCCCEKGIAKDTYCIPIAQ
jgi:hypothetical protein